MNKKLNNMELLTNISKIKENFPKHTKPYVKTFLAVALCMIKIRSTCLYKCKDKMAEVTGNTKTKAASHYKRILRLFCNRAVVSFCEGIFLLILSLLGAESNLIVIDRTNWKIGGKNVNLLTAGILFNNCFIPLCWVQLNKRGNSNFRERRHLINRFIKLWKRAGKSMKDMVAVADREFIGPEWMAYLDEKTMNFVFRLRDNMYFKLCGSVLKKNANCEVMLSK